VDGDTAHAAGVIADELGANGYCCGIERVMLPNGIVILQLK
jgi:hypothetical protein